MSRVTLLVSFLSAAALLLALAVLVLAAVTHHPFFDECVHAHYAWLISQGLSPHDDFWCVYPVLGYLIVQPFFRILPQTPDLLVVLRGFSAALLLGTGIVLSLHARRVARMRLWGWAPFALIVLTPKLGDFFAEFSIDHFAALCAVGAFVLMLEEPSRLRLAAATMLAVVSIITTPKYAVTLAPSLAAFLAYACWKTPGRWRNTLPAFLAAAAAVAALALIYRAFGCRLFQNLYWAHIFMGKWMIRFEECPIRLSRTAYAFLLHHWPLGLVLLGGIAGWAARAFRPPRAAAWAGTGILIGVAVSLAVLRKYHEQYLAPVLLPLAVFPAYLAAAVPGRIARGALSLALAGALIVTAVGQIRFRSARLERFDADRVDPLVDSTRGMGRGIDPLLPALKSMKTILSLVPPEERVVAIWEGHPVFRRDLTFITYDMGPGCSFRDVLPSGSPLVRYFDPEYFLRSLEARPPAYICLVHLENNYPPGWLEVCVDFLRRNPDLYRRIDLSGFPIFLRRDLPPRAP
ncbi:MAG: hypothetical protein NTV79_07335 [Candidatus Aureabacteria bacterium]|nr:hypothetical protein [Candidatus Auribacterota bacterium]